MKGFLLILLFMPVVLLQAAEPEEYNKRLLDDFKRNVEKFNKEKSLEPYKRLETIKHFATFHIPECEAFLLKVFPKEKNLSIIREMTMGLITLGTPKTLSAALKRGVVAMRTLIQQSTEQDPLVPDKWVYFTGKHYRMLPDMYFGQLEGTLLAVEKEEGLAYLLKNGFASPINRDPLLMKFMAYVIAGLKSEERGEALEQCLKKQRDPQVIAAILDAARGGRITSESFSKLAAKMLKSRYEASQVAAVMYLETMAKDTLKSELPNLMKSKAENVRILAVEALAGINGDLSLLYPMLEDKSWKVKVSVVRILGMSAKVEPVGRLVKALASEENPRVRNDIVDTLIRVTGKDAGQQYPAWDSWWRRHQQSADLKWRDSASLNEIKSARNVQGRTVYFGLSVSDFSSFLIDVSKSMIEEYEIEVVIKGGGRTSTKEEERVEKVRKQKIDFARDNLKKVLRKMPARLKFNIITFNHDATPWQNTLVPNSSAMQREGFVFLDDLRPVGSTNIFDTLVLALRDKQVDTIYLLSDGAPTSGLIVDTDRLLEEVRRINRLKKIRINTIGFNLEEKAQVLMRALADQNHGVFIMK